MSDKYLVTINKVIVDRLQGDKLTLPELPEVLNSVTEALAPSGSLDLELVYLLTAEQYERAVIALEENSDPYPRAEPKSNAAKIIDLNSRRKPEQS